MTAYIFRHNTGVVLAPVMANNSNEAFSNLEKEHAWIKATKCNCTLSRAVHITEPVGFDALLPSY